MNNAILTTQSIGEGGCQDLSEKDIEQLFTEHQNNVAQLPATEENEDEQE